MGDSSIFSLVFIKKKRATGGSLSLATLRAHETDLRKIAPYVVTGPVVIDTAIPINIFLGAGLFERDVSVGQKLGRAHCCSATFMGGFYITTDGWIEVLYGKKAYFRGDLALNQRAGEINLKGTRFETSNANYCPYVIGLIM